MSPEHNSIACAVGRTARIGRFMPALGMGLLLAGLTACGSSGTTNPVTAAPAFVQQPADAYTVAGATATFTAQASGSPSYQWSRGGAAINGANGATYTTPITAAADNNAVFRVAAITSGGTTNSAYATLHVNYVTLTSQPQDVASVPGVPVSLTVAASGSGAESYQWAKNGTPITGATAATLTFPAVGQGDVASYTCTVTSLLSGTSTSATTSPADQTVLPGTPVTFTVAGTNAYAYQWFRNGLAIPGATGASYTTPPAMIVDDGVAFTCQESNPLGTVTSAAATLHVNVLQITTQPASAYLPEGGALNLGTGIKSNGTVTGQWFKDGVALPGATTATFAKTPVATTDAGAYTCTYTNTLNGTVSTVSTAPAQIGVVALPVITLQPVGGTFIVGKPMSLLTAATSTSSVPLSYQWRKDGAAILAATSPTYTIPSLAATDSGVYTCLVTNAAHGIVTTATTQGAAVTVNGFPVITSQPSSLRVYEGRPATFAVAAQGPGTLAYQWYRNGAQLPGATSAAYTLASTVAATDDQATFYCVVSNGYLPNATSATATLSVTPVPANASFQATTQSITKGQGVIFTYLFNPVATATFGPQGGTAAPVTSGGATTVYPSATTTYTLTVTAGSTPQVLSIPVTVKSYAPTTLYVVNRDSNDIYQYATNPKAALVLQGGAYSFDFGANKPSDGLVQEPIATHVPTGNRPIHMAATTDEKFIYVANNGDANLSGYSPTAGTGILAPLAGSPYALPVGYTKPWCSAPDPANHHLYVSCAEGIAVFTIDSATGILTAAPSLCLPIPGHGQGDLVIHPSGAYLYLADSGHSCIKSFTLDATGALAGNGSDQPVTYASGYDPTNSVNLHNPTSLTFDRAAGLLFTRSVDILHGTDLGAVDSYAIDASTGALPALGASQSGPDAAGQPRVTGGSDEFHGLAFTALPGVDHLFDTYIVAPFAVYFSEWTVDMAPASGTYGQLTGFYGSALRYGMQAEPWYVVSMSEFCNGGTSVIRDRSGVIYAMPVINNRMFIYGSDVNGNITSMGNATGEFDVSTGTTPAHGLFVGTLN